MADPLGDLAAAGVAIWLDDLSRARLADGSLARLVRDCHVVGVTTNPTIFHEAISGSDHYDGQIRDLGARGVEVGKALRAITVRDVAVAVDLRRPAYDAGLGETGGCRSRATPGSPTTPRGRSPNVTLIFSRRRHAQVMEAFLEPKATLHAVADHGAVRGDTIHDGYNDAAEVMAELADIGIDQDEVVEQLERDGLTTFQTSRAALTQTLDRKLAAAKRGGGERNDHP